MGPRPSPPPTKDLPRPLPSNPRRPRPRRPRLRSLPEPPAPLPPLPAARPHTLALPRLARPVPSAFRRRALLASPAPAPGLRPVPAPPVPSPQSRAPSAQAPVCRPRPLPPPQGRPLSPLDASFPSWPRSFRWRPGGSTEPRVCHRSRRGARVRACVRLCPSSPGCSD